MSRSKVTDLRVVVVTAGGDEEDEQNGEDVHPDRHPTCNRPHGSGYVRIGVFRLVTRGWAASEFLTRASKFNMTPSGEHQIISPDRSHIFDAGVNFLTRASPT